MATLKKELVKRLEEIKGVEDRPTQVAGGSSIFYNGKEIAHFHNNNEIDVRLTKKVILQEGLVHPPNSEFHANRTHTSQWIELRYRRKEQLDEVVRLIKLALTQY